MGLTIVLWYSPRSVIKNPRLSSQRLARPISRITSPGCIESNTGSDSGTASTPPLLEALVARFRAFLIDAGVANGCAATRAREAEILLRKGHSAGLADLHSHGLDNNKVSVSSSRAARILARCSSGRSIYCQLI